MVDVAGTRLNKADIELIGQMQVGGIILFARNVQSPEQVRELCDAIRQVKRQSISQKSTHQETLVRCQPWEPLDNGLRQILVMPCAWRIMQAI